LVVTTVYLTLSLFKLKSAINLSEISKHIVFKEEDIIKLISILVTDGDVPESK
jgi:hypothetical protein